MQATVSGSRTCPSTVRSGKRQGRVRGQRQKTPPRRGFIGAGMGPCLDLAARPEAGTQEAERQQRQRTRIGLCDRTAAGETSVGGPTRDRSAAGLGAGILIAGKYMRRQQVAQVVARQHVGVGEPGRTRSRGDVELEVHDRVRVAIEQIVDLIELAEAVGLHGPATDDRLRSGWREGDSEGCSRRRKARRIDVRRDGLSSTENKSGERIEREGRRGATGPRHRHGAVRTCRGAEGRVRSVERVDQTRLGRDRSQSERDETRGEG